MAVLRAEIPSVDAAKFRSLPQLNEGAEARVHHDEEGKVVYKLSRSETAKPGLTCLVKCDWPQMGKFASRLAGVPPFWNSLGAWHAPTQQKI